MAALRIVVGRAGQTVVAGAGIAVELFFEAVDGVIGLLVLWVVGHLEEIIVAALLELVPSSFPQKFGWFEFLGMHVQ